MNAAPFGTMIVKREYPQAVLDAHPDGWHDPAVLPHEIHVRSTDPLTGYAVDHYAHHLGDGDYLVQDVQQVDQIAAIAAAIGQTHDVLHHAIYKDGVSPFGNDIGKDGVTAHIKTGTCIPVVGQEAAPDSVLGCYVIPMPPIALISRGIRRVAEILKAITTVGAQKAADGLTGLNSLTLFNNANSYIGVGDSTTVFSAAQTDLQASTNKVRQAMDATFPSGSAGVIVWSATFATGSANFAWQEWGIFNAAAAGSMLSRKVESLGTKTSAQSWQIQATETFAAA